MDNNLQSLMLAEVLKYSPVKIKTMVLTLTMTFGTAFTFAILGILMGNNILLEKGKNKTFNDSRPQATIRDILSRKTRRRFKKLVGRKFIEKLATFMALFYACADSVRHCFPKIFMNSISQFRHARKKEELISAKKIISTFTDNLNFFNRVGFKILNTITLAALIRKLMSISATAPNIRKIVLILIRCGIFFGIATLFFSIFCLLTLLSRWKLTEEEIIEYLLEILAEFHRLLKTSTGTGFLIIIVLKTLCYKRPLLVSMVPEETELARHSFLPSKLITCDTPLNNKIIMPPFIGEIEPLYFPEFDIKQSLKDSIQSSEGLKLPSSIKIDVYSYINCEDLSKIRVQTFSDISIDDLEMEN